ncbi:MAG: Transposase DDE domain protein [Candidatus Methanofastidiosum methylothiophilum]|uniref:Transposase DDE domain protein n=1 Tax=Candidatus Methanofastidiosum methylothiophilum TaxID=1705564 RepID=A0A150IPM3_9EURY|nr:MAG: Transposase DDE domain protein [Candidatus Methanofastidiosum methylthiophilus]
MTTLLDIAIKERYENLLKVGDKLAEISKYVNWKPFVSIVSGLYDNKSDKGGRPNMDEIVMVKMLILQGLYGLSDPELERQVNDRISFQNFLGFPEKIPDYSTVWYFRERLAKSGKDKMIWEEFQRQIESKGLGIRKGVAQDATIITSDSGKSGNGSRGEKAKTRRSKDGEWAKRKTDSKFGYKAHTKIDIDHGIVRDFTITSANVHDINVDLTKAGEVGYKDKGYSGQETLSYNGIIKKKPKGKKLSFRDIHRNNRISKKRCKVERHYAVIKRVFNFGHVLVTTISRVRVKTMFTLFCFNIYQLQTLAKNALA